MDFIKFYFNGIYNPVYDFINAQMAPYRQLQKKCIEKLELNFSDNRNVLCVGIGTGNEIDHLLQTNDTINITGVDYSETALEKAREKALVHGKRIELLHMNVQELELSDNSFDNVLCLHVMDWVENDKLATTEIMRVLKEGGKFVITYPSDRESVGMGLEVLKNTIRQTKTGKIRKIVTLLFSSIIGTFVYLPLLFRPKRRQYSKNELHSFFAGYTNGDFNIEEFPVYQDYIVSGSKTIIK